MSSLFTPIFKKGSRQGKVNYRPISVLSVLSKIVERYYGIHLISYLNEYNLLTSSQFGSRTLHSCETMLLQLTDTLLHSMDKGELSGILLVEKAFDLINHELLLQKLAIYGLKEATLQWFRSYLTERKQLVSIGHSTSDLLPVRSGIPQGSSLGPLLFILFINDIPLANTQCNSYIYVDDTTLANSGPTINTVRTHLQCGADNLATWAPENRMAIHPDKTKVMLVGTKRKLATISEPLNISICGTTLSQSSSGKLLGIHMDDCLGWNEHFSNSLIIHE